MKLRTVKNKKGNPEYNDCLEKEVTLIKKKCGLENKIVFFLGHYKFREIFLINGTIYISSITKELDLCELYKITLKKDYPKTLSDITFKTLIQLNPDYKFNPQEFLDFIDEPSEITENIDNPYYEIIKYLNNYSKNLFKTDKYLFYPKADGDSNFILNFYAYDIKNQLEMKLYIPDKWEEINDIWTLVAPNKVKDIVIDDLGQNVSNYQKLKCKKEFLKLANEINPCFKTKNYWVLELLKQTIQPVDILHEWACHRCFCDIDLFGKNKGAIWVHDFLNKNEEPYFFITDSIYLQDTTKIAVLNFKNPKYHYKGIFKKDNIKRKGWKLNEKEINKLIEFLNKPSKRVNEYCGGSLDTAYKKYVKTNWQQLIFEYNHNTALWGCGGKGFAIPPEKTQNYEGIETLPFDLPIPDYKKLLNGEEL